MSLATAVYNFKTVLYIIPVRDTRAASAFGISRAYYEIAVSNCTLYLCVGRQISNDYFTNGQMYYFGAPGFDETAFAATTEMAIWLMFWNSVWIFIQTKVPNLVGVYITIEMGPCQWDFNIAKC